MEKTKYLIVGGGISGLSFAKCTKDKYIIAEKEEELGGLCRTHYVGEYIWDYAGHFFHFADPEIKKYFERRLSDKDIVRCEKKTKIFYKGDYIDYPFQKNIHELEKKEFIECLYYLYFRKEKANYENFLDMLYGKFGKGITEKFLKPYNEKLYACSLSELDTDAMGRFFPYADMDDIIRNMYTGNNESYNSFFDYPKQGAQTFINILCSEIDMKKVKLNSELISFDLDQRTAIVNGNMIEYEYLINTIPFSRFVRLYKNEFPKDSLSSNKVLVFNLGFDKKTNIKDVHWIYYPSEEQIFYRVGFYDNILSSNKGSLYIEIGYNEEQCLNQQIVKQALEKTLQDLNNVGIISDQKLVEHEALLIDPGYVHITSDGIKNIEIELEHLKKKNVYSIGRYGRWTYCSMEDCILEAADLAKNLQQKNNKRDF